MEEKLAGIRQHAASKLDNQRNVAHVLAAVEDSLAKKEPVAYFVALLALLELATDASTSTAAAYLLDVVVAFCPPALLRQQFAPILTKMAPMLQDAPAPATKSAIGALQQVLLAQDHALWTALGTVSPKRAIVGLLELSFDPRPKVRKKAQGAVHEILRNPPALPQPTHAAGALCGDLALNRLRGLLAQKQGDAETVHALLLVGAITLANAWPALLVAPLCDVLLEVSRSKNHFLVKAAFEAFDGLFALMHEVDTERFAGVIDVIYSLKPAPDDAHLLPLWLAVVAKASAAFSRLAPHLAVAKARSALPLIAGFLALETRNIHELAAQCLVAVVESIDNDEVPETVGFLADFARQLLSIRYQHAAREVLQFIAAAVAKLGRRGSPAFVPILETVGEWRSNEDSNFSLNKEAEDVVAACVAAWGAETVLEALPLNLTSASATGRAWMLPLLRDNVRLSLLEYYKQKVLPLVDFFDTQIANATNKETLNVKMFQTVVDQVWLLLPRFCDVPTDLQSAFSDDFAARLTDLLYTKVELRPTICSALRTLAELNLAYMALEARPVEVDAEGNVRYLAAKALNILLVLFNVFSLTATDAKGFVLDTVDVYLRITSAADLETTFNKVCGLLKKAMDNDHSEPNRLSVTMMDLVVAMAKYVPELLLNALFAIFSQTVTMSADPLMQKRAYRLVTRLGDSEQGQRAVAHYIGDLERIFADSVKTHTSARAARLAALQVVVDALPPLDLHFVPAVLQEVIMSAKNANDKLRLLTFELLVQMGRKMALGGVVENSKVPGFEADAAPLEASLEAYFTMVSAGLAAKSEHMILATITALSCLVFEFKDTLDPATLRDVVATVEMFLEHNSREIAKACIGFVKVEVLSLPELLVRENLAGMLLRLMRWSHIHKDRFKQKVKHILERLIRKFGVEEVERAMPDEDKKLVASIKKARSRAKRLKEAGAEETGTVRQKKFISAYEEAVHELDSLDDEEQPGEKYILNTDEPLDLLDRLALAHISSLKPKKFTKKTMEEYSNGKLVLGDLKKEDGLGVDAYLDAVKQAPVRGLKNKLKYKKVKEEWSDDEDSTLTPKVRPGNGKVGKGNGKVGKGKGKAGKKTFKAQKKL